MLSLTRTVRFSINPPNAAGWGDPSNTFASFPSMRGLGRHYELDIRCRGDIDPNTGYFVNIKAIDSAVRAVAIPIIENACATDPAADATDVLARLIPPLNDAMNGAVSAVRWRLSPYHSVEMTAAPATPPLALIRQQFELAASHRLHVPSLTDAQNRDLFGKCNNPAGHGHNYRVEPCVAVDLSRSPTSRFSLADLERLTHKSIIARFDHTHLNQDTQEFCAERGGLNPSVENIAKVFFDLLAPAIDACDSARNGGAKLRSITVWETDKTSCVYPA